MKRFFIAGLLTAGLVCTLYSQSLHELREQSDALAKDIAAAESLLNETTNKQAANNRQLNIASTNRRNRERLVSNLNKQINVLESEVNAKSDSVAAMTEELESLKAEYADMIRSSYRNYRLNNYMAFLFASKNFNDIARRIYYMKRYTLTRERKAEAIDSLRGMLETDITQLAEKRGELDGTKSAYDSEVTKLRRQENEYQSIRSSLNTRSSQYNRELTAKRAAYERVQAEIRRVVEEEARRARSQNRTAAEQEAFILLTGRFDENKGRLPYPSVGGVIVEHFGIQRHEGLTGGNNRTVNNPTVTFAVQPGATVRTVFDGEITVISGAPATIIVRHGNYSTVYSNIETVNVKVGDKVGINQAIGRTYSGSDADRHTLGFGIHDGKAFLDPEQWIRR